ncbi:MAG TPA: c-type cytochrome [Gemmatimonadales bacterium]|nr:c-type cytochrome [Gemmatimonadales bacterium]
MSLRSHSTLVLWLAVVSLASCERETRRFREIPPTATETGDVRLTSLQPGVPTTEPTMRSAYAENAYAISEGKRLFTQYNCTGCHAQGGGGIGPPLMDDIWIYGSKPENIYSTIVEGRPNGMPAFGGKVSNQQVWQLVAYVRSMSGLLAKDVSPGRSDDMSVRAQEQSTPKAHPTPAAEPPSSERP